MVYLRKAKGLLSMFVLVFAFALLTGCLGGSNNNGKTNYSVSGKVTDTLGMGIKDVDILITGSISATVKTDADGKYTATGLSGTVTLTPSKNSWNFNPKNTVCSGARSNVNFTGTTIARTIYVPSDYATIQGAIDSAAHGDLIIVAPGTYVENIDFGGKRIVVQSTDPKNQNIVKTTVIDGGQKGSVVTFKSGETADSVLSGFTIRNGSGQPARAHTDGGICGGGIFIRETRNLPTCATISHNIIRENFAQFGGGIYNEGSDSLITNNTIEFNTTTGESMASGAGIYNRCKSGVITKNTISHNSSQSGDGGGIYNFGSTLLIEDNVISHNEAYRAGGIDNNQCTDLRICRNVISENNAGWYAGGISSFRTSGIIEANTIENNSARVGAGVYDWISGPEIKGLLIIRFNIIRGNNSEPSPYNPAGGGAAYLVDSQSIVYGNTITNNVSQFGGGLYVGYTGTEPRVQRTIQIYENDFVGNRATEAGGALWVGGTVIVDSEGNPLPDPDTFNNYQDNTPDDIYYNN